MKNKIRKVALIGSGAVGTSFLYSAMNRGIANEYGIIDLNKEVAKGNELDLEDAASTNFLPWKTTVLDYKDLTDYDIIVITAGRPQKPGETRLEMVEDNAKIMKDIALKVKSSGFSGVTIIASNPVDVLTTVYQEVTGFSTNQVMGSGTSLDTSRLTLALSARLNISPRSIQAYVIGEHGDSSVSVFSSASVSGKPLKYFLSKNNVSKDELGKIHKDMYLKAYEIINRKRATFYGIGSSLANLVHAIFNDTRSIHACGAKLDGQYGHKGFYTGTPAIIGATGIQEIVELDLNEAEQKQFDKSATTLETSLAKARAAIK